MPSVSPLDTYAAVIRDMKRRMASLERAVSRAGGEPIDWTNGFPVYDLRYTLRDGDTLTPAAAFAISRNTGATGADASPLILDGGNAPSLALRRTASNQPYIGFYDTTLGTRYGHLLMSNTGVLLAADGARTVGLYTNALPRYEISASGLHEWDGGAMLFDPVNNTFRVVSSADASVQVSRAGNAPFVAFYDTTFATRYGYVQGAATAFTVSADVAAIMLFRTSGAEQGRISASDFLWGKTSGGLGVAGINLFGTGHIYSNVGHNTATGNMYLDRSGSAVATTRPYLVFTENASGAGSVTRSGALTVAYNTSSHGPFKGDVETLDPAEAFDRIMRLRPVSFRWKVGDDGRVSEHGAPAGETEHGFIAQEHYEVLPGAVTPGSGTEADHRAWLVERERYLAECAAYDEAEGIRAALEFQHAEAEAQWRAECERIAQEWSPVTERTTDDDLVIVEFHPEQPELPDPPAEPDYPPMPDVPVDPGPSPFMPWGGDWTKDVPDIVAAMHHLAAENAALRERLDQLEARLA